MKNIIVVLCITVSTIFGCGSPQTEAGNLGTVGNPYAGKWEGRYALTGGKSVYVTITVKGDGSLYGFISNPDGINSSFVEIKGSVSAVGALYANYWPKSGNDPFGKVTGSLVINNSQLIFVTNETLPELIAGSEYKLNKAVYTLPQTSLIGVYVLVNYLDSEMAESTISGDAPSYGTAISFNGGLSGTSTAYNIVRFGDLYVTDGTQISFTDICGTQAKTSSTYDQDTVTITYNYTKWCDGKTQPVHHEMWVKLSDSVP